jgi:pantothenate kinase
VLETLARRIDAVAYTGKRRVVALAGPPASGKSTLAETLERNDSTMQVVPMDGFHLDNALLTERGLLSRKGAPETFDAAGFIHLIRRLKTEDDVVFPRFDRSLDMSIAGAGIIRPETTTILVEGNYLMLDQPVWRDLRQIWDLSVGIDVSLQVLEQRLLQRWIDHGYTPQDAQAKAAGNDLPNAKLVLENRYTCDIVIAQDQQSIMA